ncbi:hypothetical protein bcere0022_24820 [Bacillus cereus Rock3-44]|nr:hypothetical protein bcere0022_24820 [Bacillus cereus Rock3-44]
MNLNVGRDNIKMNWKKGGLWVIIFFIVKGTISTLLIVTGAQYFNLSYMQFFVLILILLLISLIGRKFLYRHKQTKKQKEINI